MINRLLPVAPDATLVTRLRALLTQPNADYFGPTGAGCLEPCCAHIRARAFRCGACGYHGAPRVEPCECREARTGNIEYFQKVLAGRAESSFSRETATALLAEWKAKPDRSCRPQIGPSDGRRKNCGHGLRWCPTCGALEGEADSLNNAGPGHLLYLLQGVRAILDGGTN